MKVLAFESPCEVLSCDHLPGESTKSSLVRNVEYCCVVDGRAFALRRQRAQVHHTDGDFIVAVEPSNAYRVLELDPSINDTRMSDLRRCEQLDWPERE